MRVVVVGAGLAGLSAALHLLGSGCEVTLLERDAAPGGRAGGRSEGGYTVDTGATVLTMPELLDETFAAVGRSAASHGELVRLDPAYHARFADGSTIRLFTDAERMEAEVRATCGPDDALGYRRLRRWLTGLYAVQREHFIGANFDSPFDLVRPELARLVALGGFGRLGRRIARFVRDERLRRLFSFQSLYAGLDPARAIGAYGVISYMDTVGGVYYPRGGMAGLARAMSDVAEEAGATVHFGISATGLDRSGSRVTGVYTSRRERIRCDAVVLATELTTAYDLCRGPRPVRTVPLRFAPSAVVLRGRASEHWRAASDELGHHTIFFGSAWERTFSELIREGVLMSDPSLLVTRPTATDPTLAPRGEQLLSVLAPAPNLHSGRIDWRRVAPAYRDDLLRTLERRGLRDVTTELDVRETVTPHDWAARGMAAGTPFSLAHTVAQTGPFRPANRLRGLDNVALAGCGTIPGVGIPPVLISGRLAAERLVGSGGRRA